MTTDRRGAEEQDKASAPDDVDEDEGEWVELRDPGPPLPVKSKGGSRGQ